jgi:uncharacterized membrane protein YdbT with pleckstrin-like domain
MKKKINIWNSYTKAIIMGLLISLFGIYYSLMLSSSVRQYFPFWGMIIFGFIIIFISLINIK